MSFLLVISQKKKKNSVGIIRIGRVIANLDNLLNIHEFLKIEIIWTRCVSNFIAAIEITRNCEERSQVYFSTFRINIDFCFQVWFVIWGKARTINNNHMLTTYHVAKFFSKRSENFNKSFFVQRRNWSWMKLKSKVKSISR